MCCTPYTIPTNPRFRSSNGLITRPFKRFNSKRTQPSILPKTNLTLFFIYFKFFYNNLPIRKQTNTRTPVHTNTYTHVQTHMSSDLPSYYLYSCHFLSHKTVKIETPQKTRSNVSELYTVDQFSHLNVYSYKVRNN